MTRLALDECDVLVIGAGPAGMAAAAAAAFGGGSVVVIDDNPAPGGQIWRDGPGVELPTAAREARNAVTQRANIRVHCGTRVVAAPRARQLLLEDGERGWLLQWKKLILCTGARELLLPFPGWTLAGVTGAGALQALIKGGMPVKGERIVVAGTGPLLLAAAATATQAGAKVLRVAEQAPLHDVLGFAAHLARWPGKARQALTLMHPGYRSGTHVLSAQGQGRLESVTLRHGRDGTEEFACDRLACGFGLVPNTELGRMLGCAVTAQPGGLALNVNANQATSVPNIFAAGECTGIGGSERALLQGAIAGHSAVGRAIPAEGQREELARWDAFAAQLHRRFSPGEQIRTLTQPDTVFCRCEDVPFGALAGRSDWNDAKLHTRCGMGACQGRVCGAAAQFLLGWSPATPRPPLTPARAATLAGFAPQLPDVPMAQGQ
ncbi:FAD/NAD(P)-binding oxidoreductase [Variovorax rhizosphaerae]|uniref:FAD/NAD(P)-binding oxidoreductase n=1 Tax=Variovorax rhizosphaerae TaxID=1836200 RepID=A0ABU8WN91_9BURK